MHSLAEEILARHRNHFLETGNGRDKVYSFVSGLKPDTLPINLDHLGQIIPKYVIESGMYSEVSELINISQL
jgi:hypothetical protein